MVCNYIKYKELIQMIILTTFFMTITCVFGFLSFGKYDGATAIKDIAQCLFAIWLALFLMCIGICIIVYKSIIKIHQETIRIFDVL